MARKKPIRKSNFFGMVSADLKKRFMALCEEERRTQAQQLEVILLDYLERRQTAQSQ